MALRLRQQRFAEEYLMDGNATQAAIRSGYSKQSAHVQGCELLKLPKVSEAIAAKRDAEMAQRAAQRAEITLDRLSDMFVEDRLFAREVGQAAAAVGATDKLARLHGYMVDRSVSMNLTAQMSDDELAQIVRAWQHQTAAPALGHEATSPALELEATSTSTPSVTPSVTPNKRPARKSLKRKANRKRGN